MNDEAIELLIHSAQNKLTLQFRSSVQFESTVQSESTQVLYRKPNVVPKNRM